MRYAFVDAMQADFDPNAFQLPEGVKASKGPEKNSDLPVSPQIQALEWEARNAQQRQQTQPSVGNQQVVANTQKQVEITASEQRAVHLKPWILRLKNPIPSQKTENKSQLLAALEALQTAYTGEQVPKDLGTMGVLYPLLKCQAYKWDGLQKVEPFEIPAAEVNYLLKLRQLKGGLGPIERAALTQLIQLINQHLQAYFSVDLSPANASLAASEAQPIPEAHFEQPFDPLAANRQILQLRAKLQRTFSAPEKQTLQAELTRLTEQMQAHFQARQLQALQKQREECRTDQTRFAEGKLTAASFESWRKLRLTTLQGLARLFSHGAGPSAAAAAAEPVGVRLLASFRAQLARLGLPDATGWIQAEGEQNQTLLRAAGLEGFEPVLLAALTDWQRDFADLLRAALQDLQRLGQSLKQSRFQTQLQALEKTQTHWKNQQAQIRSLESQYLAAADPAEQHPLKLALLQAYAEMLMQLPESPV